MINSIPYIGIVIVNYNGAKYQNECIKSIKEMGYSNLLIVVVDSASSDNSIEILAEEYKDVMILKQHENCGVAKGNNIGIHYCLEQNVDYVMLLNNDVVLDKNLLEKLLIYGDKETVAVPKIYYYEPNNVLWFAGGQMLWGKGDAIHLGINEIDFGKYDELKKISYAPTCCMLIHADIFKKVGFMDERVFMYYDDTDFCVRLIDNNINILYVPEARMWHKVSSSVGGQNSKVQVYYMTRNGLYFRKKYKDKVSAVGNIYANLKNIVKYILYPIRRKNDKMILEGYRDYRNNKFGRKDFNGV